MDVEFAIKILDKETTRYLTEGEKNERKHISEISSKND